MSQAFRTGWSVVKSDAPGDGICPECLGDYYSHETKDCAKCGYKGDGLLDRGYCGKCLAYEVNRGEECYKCGEMNE